MKISDEDIFDMFTLANEGAPPANKPCPTIFRPNTAAQEATQTIYKYTQSNLDRTFDLRSLAELTGLSYKVVYRAGLRLVRYGLVEYNLVQWPVKRKGKEMTMMERVGIRGIAPFSQKLSK